MKKKFSAQYFVFNKQVSEIQIQSAASCTRDSTWLVGIVLYYKSEFSDDFYVWFFLFNFVSRIYFIFQCLL